MRPITRAFVIGGCLLWLAAPLGAQTADGTTTGWVSPTLTFFDFSKGFGQDLTQVLERYDYRRGIGGDRRTGVLLDIGDLWLSRWDDGRERLRVERRAASYDNHRGSFRFDTDAVRIGAGYSALRTATGGVAYLFSPNRVPGGTDPLYTGGDVGYVQRFNEDSGQTRYAMLRTGIGAEATVKPAALGGLASIVVGYDRTKRSGNIFAPFTLGGSDVQGPADARAQLRWRSFDRDIDESVDVGRLAFTVSPGGRFVLNYELTADRFDNKAQDYLLADVTSGIGFGTTAADPAFLGFASGRETLPLHHVPASNLLTNRIGLSTRLGRRTALAVGYGKSILDQDSFNTRETSAGFTKGQIVNDAAFANVSVRVTPHLGLAARAGYSARTNDSMFPVAGYHDPNSAFEAQPRLDSLKRNEYGVEGTFYPKLARTSLAVGWKHETKDRDLTFGVARAIPPQRTLYNQDSEFDDVYVRFVTRPAKGVNVRVRASFISGDKIGLITEPEKGADVKLSVGYTATNGTSLSGFFGVRNPKTELAGFVGGPAPGPVSTPQQREATFSTAGVVTSYAPSEQSAFTVSYSWAQTDLATNFITTNRRRYDSPTTLAAIVFSQRQSLASVIDTHTVSVAVDARASEHSTLSANYLLTAARGDVASGVALDALPESDGHVDNTLHGVAASLDYLLKGAWTLRTSYYFDYYADQAFEELTGGRHTVALGFVMKF